MKLVVNIVVRQMYFTFVAGAFVVIAMLAGFLQPLFGIAEQTGKGQPLFNGNQNQPKIAFACNVFWGEEFLPDMLNTFDKNNIKITFFIGGSWAKRYPDVLKELARRGHELGNHTYSHPHPNALSKEKNKEQILQAEDLIKQLTDVKTTLYAPPYGEYNDTVLMAAHELGYKTIMWTVDTVDWKRPPPEVIINKISKKAQNGAIILMHPTKPTAQALPELIRQLKEKGYTITTVSDVLQ